MSVHVSRLLVAVLTVAISTAVSRSAYACYVDSECGEGQVCLDYVCKPAPRNGQPSGSNSGGSSDSSSSSGSQAPAPATAAPPDVKATVKSGTFGIDAAFPAGGGPTIGLAAFLDHNDAVRFNVGFEWDFSPKSAFQFSLEPTFRHYFGGTRLKPFIEPGLYFSYEAAALDIALTCGLGAEFFIWNTLSIGAAAGLGLQMNDVTHSSPPIKLTTGTSNIFLAYYW